MDSLSDLTGQPKPLRVRVDGLDHEYLVYPLTLDDLGRLQSWVDAQFPDPFAVVSEAIAKGDYTVAQQQYLMSQALAAATSSKRLIGTPEADRVLFALAGYQELLKLSIRKGNPDFSDDDAKRLYLHMTMGDLQALGAYTGVSMVAHDPKPSPATSEKSGSSTSRGPRRRRSTGGSSSTTR